MKGRRERRFALTAVSGSGKPSEMRVFLDLVGNDCVRLNDDAFLLRVFDFLWVNSVSGRAVVLEEVTLEVVDEVMAVDALGVVFTLFLFGAVVDMGFGWLNPPVVLGSGRKIFPCCPLFTLSASLARTDSAEAFWFDS